MQYKHKNTHKKRQLQKLSMFVALPFLGAISSFTALLYMNPVDGLTASSTSATNSALKLSTQAAPTTQAVPSTTSKNVTTSTPTAASTSSPTTTTKTAPTNTSSTATAVAFTGVSPRGSALYVDPSLAATGGPSQITSQATGIWFGAWNSDVQSAVSSVVGAAVATGTIPTLVAYDIPDRDCGGYSAGGQNSSDGYKAWIRQFAAGIGARKAIVILEPDALSQLDCLSPSDQAARYANLADAVSVLTTQTKASIYLDAGHSGWISAATMATRLQKANIAQARGFSLNVSNFDSTAVNKSYGDQIAAKTGKNYVIDTSRNGQGSNGQWCNPSGRGLGQKPTTTVGGAIDAYLWVKVPGESDGTCNGGPSAGTWWESYAEQLVANAI